MKAVKLKASFPLETVAQELNIFPLRVSRIGEILIVELDEFDATVLEVFLESAEEEE